MGKSRDTTPSRKPKKKRDKAFDLWLKRGLHQMFDNVVNEPIPEELLKLIQEDREKQD
nr:NepR family anti-sigma factor [Acetobacter pomorum]